MQSTDHNPEVLIVGAGPAGLMMACQLARHQIRCKIIEKRSQPISCSGALIVQARSLEILHQMGLANKLISEGIIARNINIVFNGKRLAIIPLRELGKGLTHFPSLLMVAQARTEQLLTEYLAEQGIAIERETELIGFAYVVDGVVATLNHGNGKQEKVKVSYLIGADGRHSTVRQQMELPFIGNAHRTSLFITDCHASIDQAPDEICISFSNQSISGFFPLVDGKWRIDGTLPVGTTPNDTIGFREVERHFLKQLKMDAEIHSPEWFSIFRSHYHYAPTFQRYRSFLIGDAAHVHSPIGAQGMNTGLHDAHNLAWKLAFVIHGKAREHLLDSYTTERLPIAKSIIKSTNRAFRLATGEDFLNRILRVKMLPIFLEKLFPWLSSLDSVRRYCFQAVSEIRIHYRESVLSNQPSIALMPNNGPRPGDRLPYILYEENGKMVNLQEKVKGDRFHLFLLVRDNPEEKLTRLSETYRHLMVTEVIKHSDNTSHLFHRLGINRSGCLLVRPDQYIAFQSSFPAAEEMEKYLRLFFHDNKVSK